MSHSTLGEDVGKVSSVLFPSGIKEKYLDQERQQKKTEPEWSKRKCVLEEIDEVKKKRIDAEIKSLNDKADELCTKAGDKLTLSLGRML